VYRSLHNFGMICWFTHLGPKHETLPVYTYVHVERLEETRNFIHFSWKAWGE